MFVRSREREREIYVSNRQFETTIKKKSVLLEVFESGESKLPITNDYS